KSARQSVPGYIANVLRGRLQSATQREDGHKPFDAAGWYAAMLQAGYDAAVVEFVEGDLQVIIIGPRDRSPITEQLDALAAHRNAFIDHLLSRPKAHAP